MKTKFCLLVLFMLIFGTLNGWSQDGGTQTNKKNVVIKYREKEKFDLDDLSIEGDGSSPGDLSIDQRYENKFKNELPHRYNFNPEIRNAVEAIR